MLKTFFIWAFVVLPLAIAVVVMPYRARWFLVGGGGERYPGSTPLRDCIEAGAGTLLVKA